jgi:hypothetical protein
MKETSLDSFGIPLILKAPDSTRIVSKSYASMDDITMRYGDFDIQLFVSEAETMKASQLRWALMEFIREQDPGVQWIHVDIDGFIFKPGSPLTDEDFDFRYVILAGDQQLIFQTGIATQSSLEDVEWMYEQVREAKIR